MAHAARWSTLGEKGSLSGRLLAGAVMAAVLVTLTGCESAVQPDFSGRGSAQYTDGLIARAILDGSYARDVVQTPTQARGVRELARVDSAGPSTMEGGAVVPTGTTGAPGTTQPTAVDTSAVLARGLVASRLNANEPTFDLSLQDAVARSVRHSLAIKVEAYNPGIRESQVIQAEAAFDPVLFGQSQWTDTDTPSFVAPSSPSVNNGQTWQNQIGVKKLLPTGATAQLTTGVTYHQIPRFATAGVSSDTLRSSYAANVGLQISQPLLRGFGTGVTEANIYLAQRDQRISLATFKRQVITTVADVEEAYQNLVLAKTNVDILGRLVRASQDTWDLVKAREGIDATKASLAQALSALQSRRADLLRAQKDYRQASDRLKNLLNDPELNIRENILINPIDKPVMEPIYYSTAEVIETALRQRTELQEARLTVEKTDIAVTVAKNDLLPKVDLVAGLQSNGLDNGFDQAFGSTINGANSIDFNAGIRIEVPIGNREAESKLVQRELERKQAITRLVQAAQTVVLDVKGQLRELLTTYEEIQIREDVRVSAAREFEGIVEIEDIRPRTPEFLQLKLDSQSRLANAEQLLIQSIVNYNLAIMKLEQAKGTLLEFNRISLDRPSVMREREDAGKNRFLGVTKPRNYARAQP